MKTIQDMGPAKLQPAEADRVREAADTVFFAENAYAMRAALADAEDLAELLVDSGRWLDETAERLLLDIEACGPQPAGIELG
jgi:hypothetical protein